MNPQPPEYVGQLVAFIFIAMVAWYAIKEYCSNKPTSYSDNFVIGYVLDNPSRKFSAYNYATQTTTTIPPLSYDLPKDPPNNPSDDDDKNPPPSPPIKPKPKPKAKSNRNNKEKTIFEADQLYFDCIEALHSLGMKKLEAKKITKTIFVAKKPKSIQDFLMVALRK